MVFTLLLSFSVKAITADELRTKINQIMDQIAQLQKQLNQKGWHHNFNENLKHGMYGDEVRALQTAMEKQGFTISDQEKTSSYFGRTTAYAVIGFQNKYASEILVPWGLTRGTGFVGPTTRAKLNELYGPVSVNQKLEPITEVSISSGCEPIVFALNKEYAEKLPNWKQQADKIIDDINFVYGKTTQKQFKISKYLTYNDSDYTNLFVHPENYPEYYQDIEDQGGITYVLLVYKEGISIQEFRERYGSNHVNVASIVEKGGKKYYIFFQGNGESWNILLDEHRSQRVYMPIHEIGHFFGLGQSE